jgi:VanZ family protein
LIADGPTPSDRAPTRPPVRAGFVLNVLPALLWAAAIFVGGGSGMPQPHLATGIPFDKVQHFLAFGGLQVLCFRALRYERPESRRRTLLWVAALLSLLFGIALELYQLGLPDRSAEVADALADGVGAAFGALLLGRLRSS